jgi:hypothetical protein
MTTVGPAKTAMQDRAVVKQTLKEKARRFFHIGGATKHVEGSDFELQALKLEAIDTINLIKGPLDMKYRQANSLADSVLQLGQFEFVTATAGGLAMLARAKVMQVQAGQIMDAQAGLLKALQQLQKANGQELSEPLGIYLDAKNRSLELIEGFALTLEELAVDAQAMLEGKAIEAWVNKNPDKATFGLGILKGVVSALVSLGTEAMPPQFKPLAGAIGMLKDAIYVAVDAINEARQVANYKEKNQKGAAFAYLDENPDAMAEMVAGIWKGRVSMVCSAAGIAANQIPGWEIVIRPAIELAATGYLDGRVKKLQMELAAAKALKQQAEGKPEEEKKGLLSGVKGTLSDMLGDHREEIAQELTNALIRGVQGADWGKLGKDAVQTLGLSLLKDVAGKIAAEIAKYFPIDPAQAVDGAALTAEVGGIAEAAGLTEYHRKGQAQKADAMPTKDKDDNPIETILSTLKEKDDTGDYLWVRIGGAVGKLYLSDLTFDGSAPNDELAKIPTKDSRDRKLDEVRPGKQDGKYVARIKKIWGLVDPEPPHQFTALRPDTSAYSDWSGRKVFASYYLEGDKRVEGKWYKPWEDQHVYMFFNSAENLMEFGHGIDPVGNVSKKSKEYNLGEMVKTFATAWPGQL